MMLAPLCRYCGKTIRKITRTIVFGNTTTSMHGNDYLLYRPEMPRTKEEAQRFTNEEIISVRYVDHYQYGRFVAQISTWDGERYQSKFFCTDNHAASFAYSVLNSKPTFGTDAYHMAIAAQEKKHAKT